jgi:hypothetical protein
MMREQAHIRQGTSTKACLGSWRKRRREGGREGGGGEEGGGGQQKRESLRLEHRLGEFC